MRLAITEQDLDAARALNRRLAYAPRFQMRHRFQPLLYQGLLRVSQIGADRRVRGRGVTLRTERVGSGEGVAVRILRPDRPLRGVVLDFHGGGWAVGNPAMDDPVNLGLIETCDVAVVSVDYRLATAAPLQALLDDCLGAARWLLDEAEGFTGLPVIVVGESAGGHLAAATMLALKHAPGFERIAGAVLYYGVYDLAGSASVRAAGPDTLVLDGPGMLDAMRLLTPDLEDAGRRQPELSPLYGDLAGMPPAMMVVGERDPLLDDTLELATRWRTAAPVDLQRVPESPHGFIHFPTPIADKVLAYAAHWVGDRLDLAGR